MKNKYLKDFVVLRQTDKPTTITVAFSMLLSNTQELEYVDARFGKGFVTAVYKINKVTADTDLPEERVIREAKSIDLLVSVNDALLEVVDKEGDPSTHITSLHIIHNPAMDRESMTTADAPTI